MAQATILVAGTTQATSTDVIVAAGATVSLGIFTADAGGIPAAQSAVVLMDTPGSDVPVYELTGANPVRSFTGPATYRVTRRAGSVSVGVFSET